MATHTKRSWRNARTIGLVTLISVAGCAVAGSSSIPKIAFEVQTDAGTILEVRVRGRGIFFSDAELQRLVKKGMGSAILRQTEGRPARSAPGQALGSMIWEVTGRPGRPEKTYVGVELLTGDGKTSRAFALMCGPNDPQVKGELMRTVSILTSRLLKVANIAQMGFATRVSMGEPNPNAISSVWSDR